MKIFGSRSVYGTAGQTAGFRTHVRSRAPLDGQRATISVSGGGRAYEEPRMRSSWTFSRRLAGLAQATRETEAGATQTLQTSSQLTSLSTSLTRRVQAT